MIGASGVWVMAVEAENTLPSSEDDDRLSERVALPLWRRVPGGVLMGLGALAAAFFLALGVTVSLTYVEWGDPVDGMGTVLMVCLPPLLAGVGLIALGRWVFGGWKADAPIVLAASYVLPIAGVVAAFGAIGGYFMALFDETGRGGAWAASQFLLCVIVSLALIVVGMALRRRLAA